MAPADQGLEKMVEGLGGVAGEPGCREAPSPAGCNRLGLKYGLEKANRYKAMKNNSFNAQHTNSTLRLV